MIELILLLQAEFDTQNIFARYEEFQPRRGEVFLRQLDASLILLRQFPANRPSLRRSLSPLAHP